MFALTALPGGRKSIVIGFYWAQIIDLAVSRRSRNLNWRFHMIGFSEVNHCFADF
jgi:hypothetical protein